MRYMCLIVLSLLFARAALAEDMSSGGISVSPAYLQNLGVRSDAVGMHDFGRNIRSYGRIAPDTRREYQLSLRKGGWIRDLKTSAVGDTVRQGDVLFTFYSPDLIAIETEYVTGSKTGYKPAAMEDRLRLYGMDDLAIAELRKKGAVIEDVPFHAPADGTVTVLNARKGAFMPEGALILTLQDFSKVWVEAHVPIRDLPFLSVGTQATVTVAQTGERAQAAIDYIYPTADPASRDGMVRLVLDNTNGKFRTDEPVEVEFSADIQSRLAVPDESVLYSGLGAYVIEDMGGGHFRVAMVNTGLTAGGFTEITSGLKPGQRIVTSGQFMLDAESNLQGSGMADMPGMGTSNMSGMDMEPRHGQ